MIASLQGRVAAIEHDHLVMVVGGLGFKVFAPRSTLERLDTGEAFLHTMLVVREDALTLFGFITEEERQVFESLLTVNGVGPRMALAILSALSLDNLRTAIISDRAEILTRVPGIGKKTAQKILIELKDKLKVDMDLASVSGFDDLNADVLDALVALGYSIVEAQTAIQSLPRDAPESIEERVRMALQYFG